MFLLSFLQKVSSDWSEVGEDVEEQDDVVQVRLDGRVDGNRRDEVEHVAEHKDKDEGTAADSQAPAAHDPGRAGRPPDPRSDRCLITTARDASTESDFAPERSSLRGSELANALRMRSLGWSGLG